MKITTNTLRLFTLALFCLLGALPLSAQQRTVTGQVLDAQGDPIAGAMVTVTGTNRVALTDAAGTFSVQAASGETLTSTFYGFTQTEVPASQTSVTITMQPDNTTLEQLVVVGYGTTRKATLTGAVSVVGNREITVTKNENVFNSLAGKLPGLRVTQTSSMPGDYGRGAVKMDIRGMGTPMVVIDGIPSSTEDLGRMNPIEIENISILKDAAASIYGSQAANGVILVTTRAGRPSSGKFNISFSANYGLQNFLYVPRSTAAHDHMMLVNEKTIYNFGANYPFNKPTLTYSAAEIEEYASGKLKSTDWSDVLFSKNVPTYNYDVSMDGGSDNINYFFNLGYRKIESSFSTGSMNYSAWNFRNNTNVKITDRLSAVVQLSGMIYERNTPTLDLWTVYKNAWIERPTSPVYYIDADGVEHRDKYARYQETMTDTNALAAIDANTSGYNQEKRNRFDGGLSLNYRIPGVDGLTASARYNYRYWASDNTTTRPTFYVYDETGGALSRQNSPSLSRSMRPGRDELLLFSLEYKKSFGDHNVEAYAGWEERYGFENGIRGSVVMKLNSVYPENGELDGRTFNQDGLGEWARRSAIGRLKYDYKGRYMAEFTFRGDASSNFSKLGSWGYFPSGSVAWRISEENFIKNTLPFVQNIKLRASYGVLGDDGGVSRAVMGYSMRAGDTAWFYNASLIGGITTNAVPNENLSWLKSKILNIGLDFDLWNGKLGGTVEVFQRKRSGIFERPLSAVPWEIGAELPQVNTNSDQQFGWEFQLTHNNRVGEVRYWASVNFTGTKSRWDYRQDTEARSSLDAYRRKDQSGRNKDIWFVNANEGGRFSNYDQITNHFMPIPQDRLPGDYWYEDWNGDGVINGNDSHPVANENLPTFFYGIQTGAAWRGFDLTMNWQGAAGVYSRYGDVFQEVAGYNGANALDRYLDRWHMADPNADPWNSTTKWISGRYPASSHPFNEQETAVRNASYIRLKTLELGYTFPNRWLEGVGLRDTRIYANVYNLLTFTTKAMKGMDPERPGDQGGGSGDTTVFQYPISRVVNFGVKLNF